MAGSADNSKMIAGLKSAQNFDFWFHSLVSELKIFYDSILFYPLKILEFLK
jgi:hypothetical protein